MYVSKIHIHVQYKEEGSHPRRESKAAGIVCNISLKLDLIFPAIRPVYKTMKDLHQDWRHSPPTPGDAPAARKIAEIPAFC